MDKTTAILLFDQYHWHPQEDQGAEEGLEEPPNQVLFEGQ
jgi:hypothetical protein